MGTWPSLRTKLLVSRSPIGTLLAQLLDLREETLASSLSATLARSSTQASRTASTATLSETALKRSKSLAAVDTSRVLIKTPSLPSALAAETQSREPDLTPTLDLAKLFTICQRTFIHSVLNFILVGVIVLINIFHIFPSNAPQQCSYCCMSNSDPIT